MAIKYRGRNMKIYTACLTVEITRRKATYLLIYVLINTAVIINLPEINCTNVSKTRGN